MKLFSDDKNVAVLKAAAGSNPKLIDYLRAHLNRIQVGDYFALLAYINRNAAHHKALQTARHIVRDKKKVATCLGFGPRFLHSTGQAYKGGPNSGVFLEVTADSAEDVKIPGRKASFGVIEAAQARGDFRVLAERGRRVLRAHVGADANSGLAALTKAARSALR